MITTNYGQENYFFLINSITISAMTTLLPVTRTISVSKQPKHTKVEVKGYLSTSSWTNRFSQSAF